MFFVDVFKYSTPAHTHAHTHVFSLSHTHTLPLAQPSPLLPVSLITRHTHMHTTHTFSLSHTHTVSQPSPLLPFSLAGLLWCYALCQRRFATYKKRPTYLKRDLHIYKETYIYKKRPAYMKGDLHSGKETCVFENIWKQSYNASMVLRFVPVEVYNPWKKRPTHTTKSRKCLIRDPSRIYGALCQRRFCTYENRQTHMNRDLHIWKETYIQRKRRKRMIRDPSRVCGAMFGASGGSPHMSKETYTYEMRPAYMKRDLYSVYGAILFGSGGSPHIKRTIQIWHTTCIYKKRPIEKRPNMYAKRPAYMERDYMHAKGPTYMKNDLHSWKETYKEYVVCASV